MNHTTQKRRDKLPNSLAYGLLLAAFLGQSQVRTCAAEGFLPLWTADNGHISDLVLIYQGGVKRLDWNADQLRPYVTWKNRNSRAEEWLFDGFLFIEFSNGRGSEYAKGYGGSPARQSDWLWLLERNFSQTNAVGALERSVAKAAKRLGSPVIKRKVVLTLPEPIYGQTNWGSVAPGQPLDFHHDSDRIAACKWHVDQAIEHWNNADVRHLELAGFYWVAEHDAQARQILPAIASHIRERGYRFYWIPYWNAGGAARWKSLGFDFAWQQPNHFFDPEKVPDSRLTDAIVFARSNGLGLEFEADARAIQQSERFRPRFYAYLDAFTREGVKSGASVAYYEGGGILIQMAKSRDKQVRAMYDTLARWVADRQKLAATLSRKKKAAD